MDFSCILDKIKYNNYENIENEEIDKTKVTELYNKYYREFIQFPEKIKGFSEKDFINTDNELVEIITNWHPDLDFGFCFIGPTGNGKTHALLSVMNKIVITLSYKYIDSTKNIVWLNYYDLLSNLKKDIIEGDGILFKRLRNVPYLFIDDICSSKNSDWNTDNLYSLLDSRVNFNLPTFFSSNNSKVKIKEELGERLFSRILGLSVIYEIKGNDIRLKYHSERLKYLKN